MLSSNTKKLLIVMLAGLSLFSIAGCSSLNLGDIDTSVNERDDMPGPGIFDDDPKTHTPSSSNNVQKKVNHSKQLSESLSEKEEFELYKQWVKIRSENASETEYQQYQEFKSWLKFKLL